MSPGAFAARFGARSVYRAAADASFERAKYYSRHGMRSMACAALTTALQHLRIWRNWETV